MNKRKVIWIYISLVFILFFSFLFIAFQASKSYYNKENEFLYNISHDNNSIEITKYIGEKKGNNIIRIPSKINKIPVTRIGDRAFEGIGLKDVLIPESVVSIGSYAFAGNRTVYDMYIRQQGKIMLTPALASSANWINSITIPLNISLIEEGAFLYNYIVIIKIGENVTLGNDNGANVFSNDFDNFYINKGRKAGNYIYKDNEWYVE